MQSLGEIISIIRKEKNIKQETLALELNCSRQFISQMEIGKKNVPDYFLIPLSKILNYDFVSLRNNIDTYQTITHYKVAKKLISAIEHEDYSNISMILQYDVVQNEFDYGYAKILKLYCLALIEYVINGNYNAALDISLNIFSMDSIDDIDSFSLSVFEGERYYSSILIMCSSLRVLGYNKLSSKVLKQSIKFFEQNYFNDILEVYTVNHFFKRLYIALLNNYSNLLVECNNYNKAYDYIQKGLDFAYRQQIIYTVDYLLDLKVKVLIKMNKVSEAKEAFNQFHVICTIIGNISFFQKASIELKEKYNVVFF